MPQKSELKKTLLTLLIAACAIVLVARSLGSLEGIATRPLMHQLDKHLVNM